MVVDVLAVTALCKLVSLAHPAKLLFQPDPIFGVPLSQVLLGAAIFEILICAFLMMVRNAVTCAFVVFAFASGILSYRAALLVSHAHACPCLGNVADWWPWLARNSQPLLAAVSFWLLLTSSVQLRGFPQGAWLTDTVGVASRILVCLGAASFVFVCVSPGTAFGYSAEEGAEFCKTLSLLQNPIATRASSAPGIYVEALGAVFSLTGVHFWIPRVLTLAIVAGAWIGLSRMMPQRISWLALVFAVAFFCSWEGVIYNIASATPEMTAAGIAGISVALLPRPGDSLLALRAMASAVLLLLGGLIDAAAALVVPGIVVALYFSWRRGGSRPNDLHQEPAASRATVMWIALVLTSGVLCSTPLVAWAQGEHSAGLNSTWFGSGFLHLGRVLAAFGSHPGTALSAGYALFFLANRRRLREMVFASTYVLTVTLWSIVNPNWFAYTIYLALPVALLAGVGLAEIARSTSQVFASQPNGARSALLAALIVSLWLGFELPSLAEAPNSVRGRGAAAKPFMEILHRYKKSVRWMFSHDGRIAANAGYLIPPELVGISDERFKDKLTQQSVLTKIKAYQCDLLVLELQPSLFDEDWQKLIRESYTKLWSDGQLAVFVRKALEPHSAGDLRRLDL